MIKAIERIKRVNGRSVGDLFARIIQDCNVSVAGQPSLQPAKVKQSFKPYVFFIIVLLRIVIVRVALHDKRSKSRVVFHRLENPLQVRCPIHTPMRSTQIQIRQTRVGAYGTDQSIHNKGHLVQLKLVVESKRISPVMPIVSRERQSLEMAQFRHSIKEIEGLCPRVEKTLRRRRLAPFLTDLKKEIGYSASERSFSK